MAEKLWGVDELAYRDAIMGQALRAKTDYAVRQPCADVEARNLDILRMANSGEKYETIAAKWGMSRGGVGHIVHKMRKRASNA